MRKKYVTFHIPNGVYSYNKFAIEVKESENIKEIMSDVYSLDGVKYLYINNSGKLKKDYKIISYDNGKYIKNI